MMNISFQYSIGIMILTYFNYLIVDSKLKSAKPVPEQPMEGILVAKQLDS